MYGFSSVTCGVRPAACLSARRSQSPRLCHNPNLASWAVGVIVRIEKLMKYEFDRSYIYTVSQLHSYKELPWLVTRCHQQSDSNLLFGIGP